VAKSQWSFKTATEISAALAARKISAVELAQDAIGRIERHDAKINAVCVRDFGRALDAARAADAALAGGETRPLLGIPLTVKESFNVAGLPTTWGVPAQKDFRPPEDALAISRVKDAGGVILGKTNVPLGLGDWQSYNDIYGTTNNPYDLGRTPGGSSGGSSAALAAGYGPLSLGSDIGGSLRVPAFHCGVFAHKPTFALVPSRGHTPPPFPPLPFDRDMAVIGPMARCALDLSLLLGVIAGPDPLEAGTAYKLDLPPPRHLELKNFRVLLIDTDPVMPTNAVVRTAIDRLAVNLGKAGVKVERESPLLPDFAASSRLFMRMLLSFLAVGFTAEIYAGAVAAAANLPAEDMSLKAERLRGIALSHRDWVMADGARARALAGAMARAVCELRRGDLPGDADAGLSARSFGGTGNTPHRHRRQGLCLSRPAGMARHRHPARPAGHRDTDRPVAGRLAGWRPDPRSVAGGSHAAKAGRTDRARIRRLCATAGV
jgi:amidase